jgi:mono/diheme cytochrome c family protein
LNKPVIHFIISALIGLGLGYVVFDVLPDNQGTEKEIAVTEETVPTVAKEEKKQDETKETATVGEETILQTKGCLGCHSVEALNLKGGATGPDLSKAYVNVEGKHGKPVTEFLKEPTSAVMSGVIGGNPLTEEEINEVVTVLKKASEAK